MGYRLQSTKSRHLTLKRTQHAILAHPARPLSTSFTQGSPLLVLRIGMWHLSQASGSLLTSLLKEAMAFWADS